MANRIPRIRIVVDIGDKNENGRIDVGGTVIVNKKAVTLEPRDLPRAPVISAVSALLGALKLSAAQLVELAIPSLSPRSLVGVLSAPSPKEKLKAAKADADA
jgi:hypothetical protein